MIISVDELREYVTTDKTDKELTALLEALEISVRKRTNNNFQKRAFRHSADLIEGVFISDGTILFKQGETVQISRSKFNDGLYTIASVDNKTFTVNESVYDENNILVTKIEYPSDVVMGVVDIIKWKLKNEAENSNDKKKVCAYSLKHYQDILLHMLLMRQKTILMRNSECLKSTVHF